jgi:hypothetical protein
MVFLSMSISVAALAQPPAGPPVDHQHHMPPDASGSPWTFMQDGVVVGLFNHQGGPRGGDEFKVPNWWMGMFTRDVGKSKLTFTTMLSLDPATVGKQGYREIFQVGEAFHGRPLVDRQHPHDLFMQLAAVWRTPLSEKTGLTIAGGPVGEPALGPVAFMHRASAAENPSAPLGHHTLDSTHIAFGVVTAAVDHGPLVLEASLFNGREPDENRWNFDFGKPDSLSGRVWYKPSETWELQVSSGRLVEPEELERGNVVRTTASASWTRREDPDFSAVTVAYGVNAAHETRRHAFLAEGTRRRGPNAVFGRIEVRHLETGVLLADTSAGVTLPPLCPSVVHCVDEAAGRRDLIGAFTGGAVRDALKLRGFEGALGATATFYAVPAALKATHGAHPVSFQIFFRLRPPAGAMGRMWNMRMSQPMAGHDMGGMPGMSGMK